MSHLPPEILNIVASYATIVEAVVIGTEVEVLGGRIVLSDAIKKCQFEVLRWLEMYDRKKLEEYPMDNWTLPVACMPIDVFKWFVERDYGHLSVTSMIVCSKPGTKVNVNQVVRLLEIARAYKGLRTSRYTMDYAAGRGYLPVVRWLHENRMDGCTQMAMDDACKNGHLEVVEYLQAHRTEGCTVRAMDWAAHNHHFDIVRFLYKHRTEGCTFRGIEASIYIGDFEVVEILNKSVKTHPGEQYSTDSVSDYSDDSDDSWM